MMTAALGLEIAVLARVLTLGEAERTALEHQPRLQQAKASTEAAEARADQALSYYLPEVKGVAIYERATYNRVTTPVRLNPVKRGTETFNSYDLGVTLSQLVWDFGQTSNRWDAARELRRAQGKSEEAVRLQVVLGVRQAFFRARAAKAMVGVARATLANLQRHQGQIEGFVRVGNRPQIDLVQVKSDVAAVRVALIQASNAYDIARAELNQAMGTIGAIDYDVADDAFPTVKAETEPLVDVVNAALGARPELAAARSRITAQELTVAAERGAYFPTISIGGYFTERGVVLDDLRWNYGGLVTLSWPLFQGGRTRARVRETRADQQALTAEQEALRQAIVVAVESAWLAVTAAREAVSAADEALALARERLRMAEGRYAAGMGSIIELGDAQLGETTAAARKVQADYDLAAARAGLTQSLGGT